ncbi:MAG: DUF4870 domain-containing protein [Lachnospiraceae bacterium]|nr:DUF4870 domain-containing protein [Lachnospiraceae bacterium]
MNARTAGIVSYITWVGWIIALIMGDQDDEFVKHHLNQALILNICATVCSAISGALSWIPIIKAIAAIVFGFIGLVVFIMAIAGIISASNNSTKPLPVIGEIKLMK